MNELKGRKQKLEVCKTIFKRKKKRFLVKNERISPFKMGGVKNKKKNLTEKAKQRSIIIIYGILLLL